MSCLKMCILLFFEPSYKYKNFHQNTYITIALFSLNICKKKHVPAVMNNVNMVHGTFVVEVVKENPPKALSISFHSD